MSLLIHEMLPVRMLKKVIYWSSLLAVIPFHHVFGGGMGLREQAEMAEKCERVDAATIVDVVRDDLLSDDALRQDAGCILLLNVSRRLGMDDAGTQTIFSRLSGDFKVVCSVAEMIDSRLAGWYHRDTAEELDDNREMYTPLFHLLGRAKDKTSKGTLLRSFLYLHDCRELLEAIPINADLLSIAIKKQKIIGDRQCCLYPGKDFASQMLDKDMRQSLLDIVEYRLKSDAATFDEMKIGTKRFIIDCMKYGDSKYGHSIRIKAARIAGMLTENGEKDLYGKIRFLAENDPYCVHRRDARTGYSLTGLRYPVREISSRILISLNSGDRLSGEKVNK